MRVFARVCASTVFTITAQESEGPGRAVGQGIAWTSVPNLTEVRICRRLAAEAP